MIEFSNYFSIIKLYLHKVYHLNLVGSSSRLPQIEYYYQQHKRLVSGTATLDIKRLFLFRRKK